MKFISSSYNSDTGYSEVIVQHLGEKFIGIAKCHPEEEAPSEYAGCALAEIRAEIKALKYERKLEKQKTDEIIRFIHACKCYKKYNMEDDTSKVMFCQLNKRIDKVNNLAEAIERRYKELDMIPRRRELTLKALERSKRTREDNNNN